MNFASTISRLPRFLRRRRLVKLMLRVSPSSSTQLITLSDGTRFFGDVRQPVPRNTLLAGCFDPDYTAVAVAFLSGGGDRRPVMFDIGANYGINSFVLCGRCPDVEFHLFDANPQLCGFLRRSAGLYPGRDFRVVNACITEHSGGHSMLRLDAANDGGSFISESGDFEVPNVSLGDYVREQGIGEIAFGKLDVEGYEANALRGLFAADEPVRLKALVVEVFHRTLKRTGSSALELLGLLEDRGFRLFHFRSSDFEAHRYNSFQVDRALRGEWLVNGQRLLLAPLDRERAEREAWVFNTDVLAVHESVELRPV